LRELAGNNLPQQMQKTVLVTGSTDGIGFAAARMLVSRGQRVLLHGRSSSRLAAAEKTLAALPGGGQVESYLADLSLMANVETLAEAVSEKHSSLDVLINNAGVYSVAEVVTQEGLDARFAVNAIAPYLLTQRLLPLLGRTGRVINISSAAQSRVDLKALAGRSDLSDREAYAQSKLALTMWSGSLAASLAKNGPAIISINPGSLLGSKMVKQAYGIPGHDINIGADILCRAALDDEFANASGKYFDNDSKRFGSPHPDALDQKKSREVVRVIETVLAELA
jgi:NAD(P)-dependent dehydrogenase (short-subunit alcohol dehydrogenase family)